MLLVANDAESCTDPSDAATAASDGSLVFTVGAVAACSGDAVELFVAVESNTDFGVEVVPVVVVPDLNASSNRV